MARAEKHTRVQGSVCERCRRRIGPSFAEKTRGSSDRESGQQDRQTDDRSPSRLLVSSFSITVLRQQHSPRLCSHRQCASPRLQSMPACTRCSGRRTDGRQGLSHWCPGESEDRRARTQALACMQSSMHAHTYAPTASGKAPWRRHASEAAGQLPRTTQASRSTTTAINRNDGRRIRAHVAAAAPAASLRAG